MFTTARFLLPSLGMPFFISSKDNTFKTLIITRKEHLSTIDLQNSYALRAVNYNGLTLPLHAVCVEKINNPNLNSPLTKILDSQKAFSFIEVTLKMADRLSERAGLTQRYILSDLTHPQIETSHHSVVLLFHSWENYKFCFISDTHVAEAWDKVQDNLSQLPDNHEELNGEKLFSISKVFSKKTFKENFINPNKNLTAFIKIANNLAASNELDFIIIGGDLVDYKFKENRRSRHHLYIQTNFKFLEDIITGKCMSGSELKVPLFTVCGNHDYRLYPYEMRNYGLEHCGMHKFLRDYFFKKIDRKGSKAISIKDLRSIIGKKGRKHSLDSYFAHFNPLQDYAVSINKTKFIFVDSGRDAFLNFFHTHFLRYNNLFKAILSSWHFPDSEGLSDRQIQFIQNESYKGNNKNIVLIFHAGLINTNFSYQPTEENFKTKDTPPITLCTSHEYKFPLLLRNHLKGPNKLRKNVLFENSLKRLGLNYGGLFKNQLRIFELACDTRFNLLGLSGHNHRNMEIKVEKARGKIFNKDYTQTGLERPYNEKASYLLRGNSLAHIQSRYKLPNTPGFYKISVINDRINSIKREKLTAKPHDLISFHARKVEGLGSPARIEILTEILSPELLNNKDRICLIVTFIIGAKETIRRGKKHSIVIKSELKEHVLSERVNQIKNEEKSEFFKKKNILFAHSFLCKLNPVLTFNFFIPENQHKKFETAVIGEYVWEIANGLQPLTLCWHPSSIFIKS